MIVGQEEYELVMVELMGAEYGVRGAMAGVMLAWWGVCWVDAIQNNQGL